MLQKLETNEVLTESEANDKFYPYSYIMVECFYDGDILKGRVVAYAPNEMSPALLDYATELNKSGECGRVITNYTKDPFEGRTLFYEIHCVDEK